MSWFYGEDIVTDIPDKMIGFVYHIENLSNNKKYIGKKNFYFAKTKIVKKKKKKIKIESDWKEYYGSNAKLLEDVDKCGRENFKRIILHFCESKGVMGYLELKEQIKHCVLESEDYYNDWIMCRIRGSHLKKL